MITKFRNYTNKQLAKGIISIDSALAELNKIMTEFIIDDDLIVNTIDELADLRSGVYTELNQRLSEGVEK